MRVVVYGLWHLGCVTASCLAAAGNRVVGLDLDAALITDLQACKPPLHEPGLTEAIAAESVSGRLSFSADPQPALQDAEVVWVTFDTPVNDQDEADVAFVRSRLETIAPFLAPGTIVLISSQVPVGFSRRLAQDWHRKQLRFAYSPENLRLGKALEVFRHPERVILGVSDASAREPLAALFAPFCQRIEWMALESAEMTKHALNAFLAVSVTFINELARICEAVGADAKEVERGLKSEGRIGPKAYLSPGSAFAGGTLARDVIFLREFGKNLHLATPLLNGVLASNQVHKSWPLTHVCQFLEGIAEPVAAVLGLTYKPGTNTLRRSSSVELCQQLHARGIKVQAYDPLVEELPDDIASVLQLRRSVHEALHGADVAVIATEWPEFRALQTCDVLTTMRRPQIIDVNHFLAGTMASEPGIRYVATGKASRQPSLKAHAV